MRATMKAMSLAVVITALGAGILLHTAAAQDSPMARLLAERSCAGCDLEGANLSGADLDGAMLYKANLRGADLSNANLNGADLTEANLEGANLSNTNFNLANLEGARTMSGLGGALTNATTTCPNGNAGPCQ